MIGLPFSTVPYSIGTQFTPNLSRDIMDNVKKSKSISSTESESSIIEDITATGNANNDFDTDIEV